MQLYHLVLEYYGKKKIGKAALGGFIDIDNAPFFQVNFKSFIDKREKECGSAEKATLLLILEEKPIRSTQVNFAVKKLRCKNEFKSERVLITLTKIR